MTDPAIILHHYDPSPFSEKVRLALGMKQAAWKSVIVAPMPPRPHLALLTGGYRRIPVLQVGADVYCDTSVILPALERLCPEPTLYPGGGRGLAQSAAFNWERSIWVAAIGVKVHFAGNAPDAFLKDRKDDYLYFDMSKDAMEPTFALNAQVVRAQFAWLADALGDGRPFMAGAQPGVLDLAWFHILWFIRSGGQGAEIDALLGLHPILPWFDRVAALGHGRPQSMTSEAALAIAKATTPAPVDGRVDGLPLGLRRGAAVTVTPDDYARVAVPGTLVSADATTVVIHRRDAETGDLHIHFPRAGFEVKAA